MRRVFTLALLALILIGGQAFATDTTAPDWTLDASDGRTVTLAAAVDEGPVVLFFWATWCPFCKALMPHLQSIQHELGSSVQILALNIRDDGNPAGFLIERGYSFTLIEEADSVAELYGVHGTPGVIIVDRDQAIRFDLYDVSRPDIPSAVKERGRSAVATFMAAYWAAEIREALDVVL